VHRARDGAFQKALVVLAHIDEGDVCSPDLGGHLFWREALYTRLGFGDHLFDGLRLRLGQDHTPSMS
jgi:hypothetical protein